MDGKLKANCFGLHVDGHSFIKTCDDKSTLVEINQNQVKEEKFKMDEKELKGNHRVNY